MTYNTYNVIKGGENMGTEFKSVRDTFNKSQIEMAIAVGVSINTWILWERGATIPNEENQLKFETVAKSLKRG